MFGHAQIKKEGASIQFDGDRDDTAEQTYWFERKFTKKEFALLAAALELSPIQERLTIEVAEDFRERQRNGYGR